MTLRTFGASIVLLSFVVLAHPALAQTTPSNIPFTGQNVPINLSMIPSEPHPGDIIRLVIGSSAIDLDRSTITWYENNKVFAQGDGLKEASLVAGPLGSEATISVTATGDAGTVARVMARIRPVEIDLLWDSSAYVPPFYRGRALPGTSGDINVYALVQFQKANASLVAEKDIIYTWYRNDTLIASNSGRGASRLTLKSTARFDRDIIRVVAESVDTSFSGSATVVIPRKDTKVLLYENHPLFGILFHRAIVGEVNTNEREQKISAYPYFANINIPQESTLLYEWRVNNENIAPNPAEPNTLTISVNNYVGPANVELSLMSANDIFMRAQEAWRILFGESSNAFFESGVFGQ